MYQALPPRLYVKDSPISGQGIFAKEDIPAGMVLGMSHLVVDEVIYRTPLGGFINHSDIPNCFINTNIHYHKGQQRELYTVRPIHTGEELTVFYTVGYDDILQ